MGKVFYVTKNVGLGLLVVAAGAVATIIALSIAYHTERAKSQRTPGADAADSSAVPTTEPVSSEELWDRYRLPDSLVPVSYNVTLWPRLTPNADGLYIFTGHSAVVFKCVKETDVILLHSNKLNISTFHGHLARLRGLGPAPAPAVHKSWLVVKTEYLVVQLSSRLSVGASYLLYTEFRGELADDLEGFYRTEYVEDGVKK